MPQRRINTPFPPIPNSAWLDWVPTNVHWYKDGVDIGYSGAYELKGRTRSVIGLIEFELFFTYVQPTGDENHADKVFHDLPTVADYNGMEHLDIVWTVYTQATKVYTAITGYDAWIDQYWSRVCWYLPEDQPTGYSPHAHIYGAYPLAIP